MPSGNNIICCVIKVIKGGMIMIHKGTQILNTERLTLRRFIYDDAKEMFNNYPNDENKEAEVGYCIMKKHWGKGIMVEALAKTIEYSFDVVGFNRLYAKHDVENINSGKVMIKCGMRYIDTRNAPLALKPDKIVLCDCYEIFNSNLL